MLLVDRQWLWLAALCYLSGLAFGTFSIFRERRFSQRAMYVIILIGYLLQTLGLAARGRAVQGCPLGNTFEIFQFTAWASTSLYILIGATFRLSMLGFFTSCLSAVLTLLSLSIPSWDATRITALFGGNAWVALHAGLAVFSYGVFGMLALTSLLYLLRQHSLKSKNLGGWFSFLPSLLDLEQISLRLLIAGVCCMSAAVVVGLVYWRLDAGMVNVTKLISVVFVWAAYAGTLLLRLLGRVVAGRFAWLCALLFLVAMISLGPVDRSRYPDKRSAVERIHAP